jgi:tRNA(Ile)-lysidine synthase
MLQEMLQKFKKFITDNGLIKQGDRILLAVSGGIDSMVMTHLFMQSGNEFGIAHCNFSLRATESEMDEEMVAKFAADHNIEFFTTRFETKTYARENGISVQMAARELRYKWFEEIRKENGYDTIAVAHNLNDNIETLMINLIRGTGIAGLTGMKPAFNNIIRPLLFATRQDIISYCNRNMIIYREDMSNADTKYLRNKIRHLIIPLLREINPAVESTLNEAVERFTGINEIVTGYINELRERVSEQKNEYITFNISLLNSYIHNKVVIFELFRPYGISDVSLNDLIHIIEGKTGSWLFTGTHRIVKNRKEILVLKNKEKDEGDVKRLIINLRNFEKIPEIEYVRSVSITDKFKIPAGLFFSCIDSDKISFPLILRKWNKGDNFYPLGMNHRKKLSDYFIDKKFSIFDKENALIIESDGKIVCILGDRIDNRFRITDSTKNALIIKTRQKGYPGKTNQ